MNVITQTYDTLNFCMENRSTKLLSSQNCELMHINISYSRYSDDDGNGLFLLSCRYHITQQLPDHGSHLTLLSVLGHLDRSELRTNEH